MDPLLTVVFTAAITGGLAFVAGLLVKARQSLLGYVGAGFLGMGIGDWVAGLIKVSDPLTLRTDWASIPILFTFGGALVVLLIFRLVRGRGRM